MGVGATLGAALGAGLATVVFGGIGPYTLMLIAAFGLLVPVALTIIVNRRESRANREQDVVAEKPLAKADGFKLVLEHPVSAADRADGARLQPREHIGRDLHSGQPDLAGG